MPLVAVGLVALFIALSLLAFYLSYTHALEPLLKFLADSVPVVGGYLNRGIDAMGRKIRAYWHGLLAHSVQPIVSFFNGIEDNVREFISSIADFSTSVERAFEALLADTIPRKIEAALGSVRRTATTAYNDAQAALTGIDQLRKDVALDLRGIGNDIAGQVDRVETAIRNVDLPHLERLLRQDFTKGIDAVSGELTDLEGFLDQQLTDVWKYLGELPKADLIALLAAVPALAALVNTIATEAGLENADCRSKVKGICTTPLDEWAGLLDDLIPLTLAFSLAEMFSLIESIGNELVPGIAEVIS